MARKKKKSKIPLIVGSVIIFVMVSSMFGIMFSSYSDERKKEKYGDYIFIPAGANYMVEVGGKKLAFEYLPSSIESVTIDKEIVRRLRDAPEIDISYNYSSEAAPYIALLAYQWENEYLAEKYIRAGASGRNALNHTIIKCSDATPSVPVIHFRVSNQTAVYLDGNCIVADAFSGPDINVLKERLAYSILGIMD